MLCTPLSVHFILVCALTTTFLLFSILSFGNGCAADVCAAALYLSAQGQWQEALL